MAYIFLDESGDLGFDFSKKRTSRYFVVTLLFLSGSKRPLEKIVRKTHSELRKSIKRKISVLHATDENETTRKRLLQRISEKECSVMTIFLDKSKVYTRLQNEKQVLYNYVTNILLDRVYSKQIIHHTEKVELVAEQRETNKFLNENFCQYLQQKVLVSHNGEISVSIKTASEEKILQATDFVSWAIFRKYEYGDEEYYNIIKNCIVEENGLFK